VLIQGDVTNMDKKIETTISKVTGSSLNIASEHSTATTSYNATTVVKPIDKATDELIYLLKSELNPETFPIVKGLVNQAAEESKNDNKDESKIKGILSILEPLVQTAGLIPAAVQAYQNWATMLTT
jgi:hypothetical protein